MKRLTEIIAFLFLGSLVFFSGLFLIIVHAQLDFRGILTNTNLTNLNNANAVSSPSGTNVLTGATSTSGTTASSTAYTSLTNTNSLDATLPANLNTTTPTSTPSSVTTPLSNNTNTVLSNPDAALDPNANVTLQGNTNDARILNTNALDSSQNLTNVNTRTDTPGTGLKNTNDAVPVNERGETGRQANESPTNTNTTPVELREPSGAAGETAKEFSNVNESRPEGGPGFIDQNISPSAPEGQVSGAQGESGELRRNRPSNDVYVQYCVSFGIVDSNECQTLLSLDLNPECKKERIITPETCERFLRRKYVENKCSQAADRDRAACIAQLIESGSRVIHCGSRTTDECETITAQHAGEIIASDLQNDALAASLNLTLGSTTSVGKILSILARENQPRETFPLDVDPGRSVVLRSSDQTIDVSSGIRAELTVPYVIMNDDDNDGLQNDLEDYYYTDPADSDSDDDSYPDGTELINGYNPLQKGGGKVIVLQPVEKALLTSAFIEQPQARGEVSPLFGVDAVQPPVSDTGYIIHGRAEPDSFVLIYVYSQMPLVLLVKTEEYDGRWTYELKDNLVDGKHTVYVAVTDDTGKITHKSNPFTFFVQKTQAVSASNFLRDQPISEFETNQNWQTLQYVIGGAGIVILGLGIFFAIYFSRRARHDYQGQ